MKFLDLLYSFDLRGDTKYKANMDTSEKYIRMSDHPLIQKHWKCEDGDFVSTRGSFFVVGSDVFGCRKLLSKYPSVLIAIPKTEISAITVGDGFPHQEMAYKTIEFSAKRIRSPVWLPYQGQIQKMMGLSNPNKWYSSMPSDDGYPLWDVRGEFNWDSAETGEQLWLMFYMYTEHNMLWDDKKGWVKVK